MEKKTIKKSAYGILSAWHEMGSPSTTLEEMSESEKSLLFEGVDSENGRASKVLKKTISLTSEGDLQDILVERLASMEPTETKDRKFREVYEVTRDRTGKRMLVRARFDGEPFFDVGDNVKISVEILGCEHCNKENEAAIVLRKVEDDEDEGSES